MAGDHRNTRPLIWWLWKVPIIVNDQFMSDRSLKRSIVVSTRVHILITLQLYANIWSWHYFTFLNCSKNYILMLHQSRWTIVNLLLLFNLQGWDKSDILIIHELVICANCTMWWTLFKNWAKALRHIIYLLSGRQVT